MVKNLNLKKNKVIFSHNIFMHLKYVSLLEKNKVIISCRLLNIELKLL